MPLASSTPAAARSAGPMSSSCVAAVWMTASAVRAGSASDSGDRRSARTGSMPRTSSTAAASSVRAVPATSYPARPSASATAAPM